VQYHKNIFLIKLEVKKFPKVLSEVENKFKVFFGACTLRPETMYGQTNCWILPNGTYGVYQINEKEAFILTERAAKNLSFQGFSPEEKKNKMFN